MEMSLRQKIDLRKERPELLDSPELRPWLEIYWDAFVELDSCRTLGMGVGPVPWTAVIEYARVEGWDPEQQWRLRYFVRKMDVVIMEHARNQQNGDKPGSKPVRPENAPGRQTLRRPRRRRG